MSQETVYLRFLAQDVAVNGRVPLFTEDFLSYLVSLSSTLNRAAQLAWQAKAGYFAGQIDVEESGAVRKLSQLYSQANKQASAYGVLADQEAQAISAGTRVPGAVGVPWGRQQLRPNGGMQSLIIGDASRGAAGLVIFIEVPTLQQLATTGPQPQPGALHLVSSPKVVQEDERVDLVAYQGLTFSTMLVYYQEDGVTPVDLSGYSGHFASGVIGSGALVLDTSTGGVVLGADGTVALYAAPATMAGLSLGSTDYSLVLTKGPDKLLAAQGMLRLVSV